MQHQALARGKADAEPPVLPADLVAFDDEARPFFLDDFQRLRRILPYLDVLASPVPRLRRQGHNAVVLDANDRHRVKVDNRDHAFERPGESVVPRLTSDEAEGSQQPPAFVRGYLRAVV